MLVHMSTVISYVLNEQDYNRTGYLYKLQARSPLLHSYKETVINYNSITREHTVY